MPTGYTAGILDGTIETFEQFAKSCTRAFGASVHMRDEPLDKEWEEAKPSEYHPEKLSKIKEEIERVNLLSDDELIQDELKTIAESEEYFIKGRNTAIQNKEMLNTFLSKAESWNPPTEDHENFKDFMVDQIKSTISFDCSTRYYDEGLARLESEKDNINASAIRIARVEKLKKDFEYHTAEYNKDVKRCNERNNWIKYVFDSLKQTAGNQINEID